MEFASLGRVRVKQAYLVVAEIRELHENLNEEAQNGLSAPYPEV
jgi:hypothetical protein